MFGRVVGERKCLLLIEAVFVFEVNFVSELTRSPIQMQLNLIKSYAAPSNGSRCQLSRVLLSACNVRRALVESIDTLNT